MKQIIFTFLVIIFTSSIYAQAPQAFNYQGVARDFAGTPISDKNISLQIAILQGSANGTEVYKELHNTTTTDLGLFNLQIGTGTVVNGDFEDVNWGSDSHFLQIELDENGGNNYQVIGTSELLSVPYALFAKNGSKWNASQFNDGLQYENSIVIGEDEETSANFWLNNTNPEIGISTNTLLASFNRDYNNSIATFNIYAYPDTDLVYEHMRNSVMLYSTNDAKDLLLCAKPINGAIRFITGDWVSPLSERARITSIGLGIGTTNPKEKLHISNGDIYIEDINQGVIMKSPDGQCWRMTVSNTGESIFTSITCP